MRYLIERLCVHAIELVALVVIASFLLAIISGVGSVLFFVGRSARRFANRAVTY